VDHFFLIEHHLTPMLDIVVEMGDQHANTVPDLPGANSAYAIVFHCCGMLEWWTAHAILGRDVARDRAAEFVASGTVEDLRTRVEGVVAQLRRDLALIDPARPLAVPDAAVQGGYAGTPIEASAGGALLHVLEELAQHHGHLEITRDVVLAGG
jgi:hypothetical protein